MKRAEERKAKLQLIEAAKRVLAGQVHPIEGVREICTLRFRLSNPNDELFHQLMTIDDETESFPLGSVREKWAVSKLEARDKDLQTYLNSAKSDIVAACEQIVQRFSEELDV